MAFLNYTGLTTFYSKLKGILDTKVNGDGISSIKTLTKEEYDALSPADKNDGTIYITNEGFGPISDEEIDALFESGEG